MKINVTKNVEGVGNKLFMITYSESPTFYSELFFGNDDKDVLVQWFKRNNWDEDFVRNQFSNVGWVFDEDFDVDNDQDEGFETIDLELIGEVID